MTLDPPHRCDAAQTRQMLISSNPVIESLTLELSMSPLACPTSMTARSERSGIQEGLALQPCLPVLAAELMAQVPRKGLAVACCARCAG